MANDSKRRGSDSSDKLQDVGVSGVSDKSSTLGGDEDALRVFDGDGFLVHYRHIQSNREALPVNGCGFCQSPLATYVPEGARKVARDSVVQSDRADKKEDPSFAPDSDRTYWEHDLFR